MVVLGGMMSCLSVTSMMFSSELGGSSYGDLQGCILIMCPLESGCVSVIVSVLLSSLSSKIVVWRFRLGLWCHLCSSLMFFR